jgi:hypothetical protein
MLSVGSGRLHLDLDALLLWLAQFPGLDGGQMVFVLIELIRGKRSVVVPAAARAVSSC